MAWFWAVWAAVGAIAEAIGANPRRTEPGTFSTNLRKVVNVHPLVHKATLAGFVGFAAWFVPHIWGKR